MPEQTPDQTAERINQLEEQIAHLTRAVDDMSEIVTRQEDEIVTLNRRVHMLMQREGERDASGGGAVVMGDERPPHY
ncbi:SlyX protein [Sulfitobacter sp. HI0076]|jgi:SlyX protein|nr:SlyX protein [Sulfitobacter sp. HI0027]KZX98532.1 SlyX protein [Sulfitobacter sp. HI0021]KZZ02088.1 SlyX protein [Sulfitobacter sp. HI0076]